MVSRGSTRIPRRLLVLCLVAEALVVLPVIIVLDQAATAGHAVWSRDIRSAVVGTLVLHSVGIAALVTPICGIVGTAAAWFVERTRLPGGRVWRVLLVAPLTVPAFVTSYAWANLSSAFTGFWGAVLVTSCTYFPLVFLLVSAGLRGLDPALEESARSLGCSTWSVFRRVVLPQVRPALLGGMLLVALDALVEFDAFAALRIETLSTFDYSQYLTSFSVKSAAVLSLASIVLCVALVAGEGFLRGGASYVRVSHGVRRAPSLIPLHRAAGWVTAGIGAVVATSLGVPLALLVSWFAQSSHQALSAAAQGAQYLLPAAATSVGLGVGGALIALLIALPIALAVTRHRGRLASLIERGSYLSYALPDLVGAIALAYLATHWLHPFYESLSLLVVAYAILFVPLAVVAVRATLGQVEQRLEDCARSLGAGRFATLWRVTLPVARPGLAAAGVLVFAFVVGDLSTTLVLLPPGMYTLATQFDSNAKTVAFAAAAPYAAVIIVLALIATYVLMTRFGQIRKLEVR